MRRNSTLAVGVLVAMFFSVAFAGTAPAEQCSPDGKVCILNPPTAAEPWTGSPLVQMRVPAETDQLRVSWRNSDHPDYERFPMGMQPVVQGLPDGTSVWEGMITPWLGNTENASIPRDGTLVLSAEYWFDAPPPVYSNLQGTVTFADLPVLGLVYGITESLKRRGKKYVATLAATGRAPISAKVKMYIWAINPKTKNYETPGKRVRHQASVSGGDVRAVTTLPQRYVREKCLPYRHCWLIAEGDITMTGLTHGSNIGIPQRFRVK